MNQMSSQVNQGSALANQGSTQVNRKLDTDTQVFFYEQDHYYLSNFSSFKVVFNNILFDIAEAAYHWQKFPHNSSMQEFIKNAGSAHDAFKFAETNKAYRREDWDEVKVDIMFNILMEKVKQHKYVHDKLLATGDRELVEDSWRDSYWGWGENKQGNNMLGLLWMNIRNIIRLVEACPGIKAPWPWQQPKEFHWWPSV